jgi:mitogen-activated protein kinase kinase 1
MTMSRKKLQLAPIVTDGARKYNSDPTILRVQDNITIGERGLIVNGERSSIIEGLTDLEDICVLGSGACGIVKKVKHKTSNQIYALKTVTAEIDDKVLNKQLLELKTYHQSNHPYIVSFHGAFFTEGRLSFVLEYMDAGTLADLIKAGPITENVLARLTAQILTGLEYLHKQLHIIHRDIKPQNILINSKGQAKITDFGVSGEIAHTQAMAKTFVGTAKYMSPDRIAGNVHSAKSDIWSLGLVVLECALGKHPYEANKRNSGSSFFELLNDIVRQPPPMPPSDRFSAEFVSFIRDCLQKEEDKRADSTSLLKHPFITKCTESDADVSAWIKKTLISLGKPVSNEPIEANINNNANDEASKKLKMTQSAPATLPGPKISTIVDDELGSGLKKKKKDKEKKFKVK